MEESNFSQNSIEYLLEIVNSKNPTYTMKLPRNLLKVKMIIQWMNETGSSDVPKLNNDKNSNAENKLARIWGFIKEKLLNPYNGLENPEEKEMFLKRIFEVAKFDTEYEFEELMSIVWQLENIEKRNQQKVVDSEKKSVMGIRERLQIPDSIEIIDDENINSALFKKALAISMWLKQNGNPRQLRINGRTTKRDETTIASDCLELKSTIVDRYRKHENQKDFGRFVAYLKKIYNLTDDQLAKIIKIVESIEIIRIQENPIYYENALLVKAWMDSHEGKAPSKSDDASEEEKFLKRKLTNIWTYLVKPYIECETQEEREEFVARLEKVKSHISKEQFYEILSIYIKACPRRVIGEDLGKISFIATATECDEAEKTIKGLEEKKKDK